MFVRVPLCRVPSFPLSSSFSAPFPFAFSFSSRHLPQPALHSFPTRRSSDLVRSADPRTWRDHSSGVREGHHILLPGAGRDRKSTRLNSSHLGTSYAVFCLKKKTIRSRLWTTPQTQTRTTFRQPPN